MDIPLFDSHCHIHEITGSDDIAGKWHRNKITDAEAVWHEARTAGVAELMVVGCTPEDSALAVAFADGRPGCYASVGIHPHEAGRYRPDQAARQRFADLLAAPSVRAIGECGLDYYYEHATPADQQAMLRWQLELARAHDLPVIFHVRSAFADFWPIYDSFPGIRGVIHSFTADTATLHAILQRDLYVGLNGIMTFTDDQAQLDAAKQVPLERLLIETDAPFLTPKPHRGKVNIPKYVRDTAAFLAELRGEPLETLAAATTHNARQLFAVA